MLNLLKKVLATAITVAFIELAPAISPAHAQADKATSPKATVQTIIEKARTLDKAATRAENARTIESLVDFRKLALDALGANAKLATPAQKKQIENLLRKIITLTVYPEAPAFFRDVTIDYTGEEKTPQGTTHITSVVNKGQKRSTVEYWLALDGGRYKVVDLAIEGERWVENVHDQFDEVIHKKGVSDLIRRMKRRLTELESSKGSKK